MTGAILRPKFPKRHDRSPSAFLTVWQDTHTRQWAVDHTSKYGDSVGLVAKDIPTKEEAWRIARAYADRHGLEFEPISPPTGGDAA